MKDGNLRILRFQPLGMSVALSALRCYNLDRDGVKLGDMHKSVDKIVAKCAKSPLLIPHRINREIAKMRRREKML